jgi:hypothetical protein
VFLCVLGFAREVNTCATHGFFAGDTSLPSAETVLPRLQFLSSGSSVLRVHGCAVIGVLQGMKFVAG